MIGVRGMALVGCFAKAAGVRRGSRDCQRDRNKSSDEREHQQKSGGQALHDCAGESEPCGGVSIEHIREGVQAEGSCCGFDPESPPFDSAQGRLSRKEREK